MYANWPELVAVSVQQPDESLTLEGKPASELCEQGESLVLHLLNCSSKICKTEQVSEVKSKSSIVQRGWQHVIKAANSLGNKLLSSLGFTSE